MRCKRESVGDLGISPLTVERNVGGNQLDSQQAYVRILNKDVTDKW